MKEAIREGMGITEDILIERAHRSGKAIVAKFLSYKQKTTVLTQARKLNQSETFKNIYVREDFSETVRMKRKELMSLQREIRQNGHLHPSYDLTSLSQTAPSSPMTLTDKKSEEKTTVADTVAVDLLQSGTVD